MGQSVYQDNADLLPYCFTCNRPQTIKNPSTDIIQKDLELVKAYVNPIASLPPSFKAYREVYPNLELTDNTDTAHANLADGLVLTRYHISGGYTDLELIILRYNDLIIRSRLVVHVRQPVFSDYYLKAITIPLTCSGNDMEFEQLFNENLQTYQEQFPKVVFNLDRNKYNTDISTAFYNLNYHELFVSNDWCDTILVASIDEDTNYFTHHFFKMLITAKAYDVIERLLFGIQPISRIYAYTLLKTASGNGYTPNDAAISQMEKIKSQQLLFKVEDRCYRIATVDLTSGMITLAEAH